MSTQRVGRALLAQRAPRCLYRAHGNLANRLFMPGPKLHIRAALGIVRWVLDRFEMHQLRHGPSIGCPSCEHYGSICDGCRAQRKAMWG